MVAPTTTEVTESHLFSTLTPDAAPARPSHEPGGFGPGRAGSGFRRHRHQPALHLEGVFDAAGGAKAGVDDLFGILSLMFWALIMVVTVKYLTFVMRADHNGEGGIFALLAIVPERFRTHPAQSGKVTGMALLAVIGASLLYGDGVITPAISVLSAVEGLTVASPRLSPLVLPITCAHSRRALLDPAARDRRCRQALRSGDGVWFTTMAALGMYHLIQKPEILARSRRIMGRLSSSAMASTACSSSVRSSWP